MSPEGFDFVTRVNYTGYFLCVKTFAPVMRLQRRFRPGLTMDIVQVNSKSGLQGSNRNFAYAGGKFGGIGLTQSFALELVDDGIKVNAVCPGNFFEGPLWSDPEKGLFVQYLSGGKVPGARPSTTCAGSTSPRCRWEGDAGPRTSCARSSTWWSRSTRRARLCR